MWKRCEYFPDALYVRSRMRVEIEGRRYNLFIFIFPLLCVSGDISLLQSDVLHFLSDAVDLGQTGRTPGLHQTAGTRGKRERDRDRRRDGQGGRKGERERGQRTFSWSCSRLCRLLSTRSCFSCCSFSRAEAKGVNCSLASYTHTHILNIR